MKRLLIQAEIYKEKERISGLVYHRQIVPHHYMSDLIDWRCDMVNSITQQSDEYLKQYDAVIFLRNIDVNGNSSIIINRLRNLGLKIIFDIDDYWYLPEYHALRKKYTKLNIPEQTEFDIRNSDIITTTTIHFAKKISKINRNVYVLPNALDIKNPQWQQNKNESSLIRFGWIGGVYHKPDINLLKYSISKCYSHLKGFQFCLGGFNPSKEYIEMEAILADNYRKLNPEYVDYLKQMTPLIDHVSYHQPYRRLWGKDVFSYGMLYNDIDVALIPLVQNEFNACKSEIKLIEAGIHRKAAIVSRVKPYDIFPEDCVLFVDDNYHGWFKAIRKLINDPEYTETLANNLHEYVKNNYDINYWTEQRKKIYSELLCK